MCLNNNNSEILSSFWQVAWTERELCNFYNNQLQLKQVPSGYNVPIVDLTLLEQHYELQHINDEQVWTS